MAFDDAIDEIGPVAFAEQRAALIDALKPRGGGDGFLRGSRQFRECGNGFHGREFVHRHGGYEPSRGWQAGQTNLASRGLALT